MTTPYLALFAGALLAGLALPFGAADDTYCVTEGQPPPERCCKTELGLPIMVDGSTAFYLDVRENPDAGLVWLYQESNDKAGLQRGGDTVWGEAYPRSDACYDQLPSLPSDTPLF